MLIILRPPHRRTLTTATEVSTSDTVELCTDSTSCSPYETHPFARERRPTFAVSYLLPSRTPLANSLNKNKTAPTLPLHSLRSYASFVNYHKWRVYWNIAFITAELFDSLAKLSIINEVLNMGKGILITAFSSEHRFMTVYPCPCFAHLYIRGEWWEGYIALFSSGGKNLADRSISLFRRRGGLA